MSLEVKNTSFSYSKGIPVFADISFTAVKNDVLCILGPNGCGKTTLLKCVSGILKPGQGEIILDGQNIAHLRRSQIARVVGYIPQEQTSSFAYSVLEVVLMGRSPHLKMFASPAKRDFNIALEAMETVGISYLKDKRYNEISGGERQLALVARTLTQQPRVLLLDEPISHLDFKNQTLILRLIKKLAKGGLSVIMTSHFPDHALTYAGQIALMSQGSFLAQGGPHEVVTEENLWKTYGIEVKIFTFKDPLSGEDFRFCRAK